MRKKKTNLRLEEALCSRVMENLATGETFSKFLRDSLSRYLRLLRLRPRLISDCDYEYITNHSKLHVPEYSSRLRNVTVWLYAADCDFCKLSDYNITKTVRVSLIDEILRRNGA